MKERSKRVLTLCAVILTVAVLAVPIASLVGIVGNAIAAEEEPKESVLRIGFMQMVDSLNPYLGLSDSAYVFYGLVYDYMQSVGNDLEAVPNLATESRLVDVAGYPHGSVWEYDITTNATWHDGEQVTPEDIAWNINLNCIGANYTDMWAYQPYMYFAKYAEVIPGTNTVRVVYYDRETGELMPAAYAYLIGTPMVPKHLLEDFGTSYISFQWSGYFDDSDPKLVGTGPFMAGPDIVSEYAQGDQITLVKNPDYHWAKDKGMEIKFDKLIMYFYNDDTAMKIALEQGNLDVAQFPPNTFRSIQDDIDAGRLKNVETYSGLKCTQYWTEIGFNMNEGGPNKWRLDPLARQALAQAVNKTYIINNYYKGYGREGTGLISPVTPYWHWEPSAEEHWDYDLAAAAAALEAAGYVNMDSDWVRECSVSSRAVQEGWCLEGDELKLDMMIRIEYPEEKEIARFLSDQWKEIGVDMTFRIMLEDVLAKNCYAYGYDTMIWYWSSDPDPNFMLFCQSKKSIDGWSDNMYNNPDYEANYSASIREFDQAKRQEYVFNCQEISYKDAAYIVLAYVYSTYAWRTDSWIGWGDWAADPSRSLDAFWTANPLFFDLEYSPPPPKEFPLLAVIAVIAVAVVAVVALLYLRKRKQKQREIGGGDEGGSPLGD